MFYEDKTHEEKEEEEEEEEDTETIHLCLAHSQTHLLWWCYFVDLDS